jgi:carbon-monoxide dehydrogenase large subunit
MSNSKNVSINRIEDDPLLKGEGRFVDDLNVENLLHAYFVRSTVAHAKIISIDIESAKILDGVIGIYLFNDLLPIIKKRQMTQAIASSMLKFDVDPEWLAHDEVCYVGEPIAIVVAKSRSIAEDAAQSVFIDYELLPVVVDPKLGLVPGSSKARLNYPNNLVAHTIVKYGDIPELNKINCISQTFVLNKGGGHSLEPRGILSTYDLNEEKLTVWDSTQMPHRLKDTLVQMLEMSEYQIRVIAPDVGGGFGPKAVIHPEEVTIPALSILLKQPIKWIEDRKESFTATVHERLQYWEMQVFYTDDAKLLGIKGHLYHDHGSCSPYGVALPYNAVTNLIGPYVLPAVEIEILVCLTNFVPATPTRGAGRPQGTFVMERLLDQIAQKLNLRPEEVRLRNLIPKESMPYVIPIVQRDGSEMCYDTGNYAECQHKAMELFNYDEFLLRQQNALSEGRFIGVGLSNYVEATGRGPFETGSVKIGASGKIIVSTGATAQGQGVKTMIAQIVSNELNVSPQEIRVIDGDTDYCSLGFGAFASRQAVTAGNAIYVAAQKISEKIRKTAAVLLEVSYDDIVLKDGWAVVKGANDLKLTFAEIAKRLNGVPGFALPSGMSPGLSELIHFEPKGLTYSNGTHIAEVEVDINSGFVKINRYLVFHDCGNIINQMMVEGQVVGGVVHGIGATLYELMRYDENGQPLSITYGDYLLPTSDVVPKIEVYHMESPTYLNPLGVKGAAESGTIGAPAAIVSAIENALKNFSVSINDLPILPNQLIEKIHQVTVNFDSI